MKKLKKCLLSENGMRLVNTAFFLAVFIRRSGVIIAAYLLWMAYLYFVIKSTSSSFSCARISGSLLSKYSSAPA